MYYLDNNEGQTLRAKGIELALLSPYSPGESHTGEIYFYSPDPDIIRLPFVKLGIGKACL
ncbi:TPA: hypothetical protein ONC18_004631 [Enterobacter kobei]|nr:hypothetical protein [Enterobacter kobei]